ncbi:MAG: hypothetical protein Phog2KO_31700 [Phototrophicaceae bacterium]
MSQSKTFQIIHALIPDVLAEPDLLPSQFIHKYWEIYNEVYPTNRNINGSVFEELIAITLVRKGITPFYMQAQVAFIPNANYDIVIYSEEIGPIVLSAKTSIRERYKQADLEAMALKNVHRKSESYLISASESETKARKNRVDDVVALNDFIYVFSSEYDDLLEKISQKTIIEAPTIKIVEKSQKFITAQNYWDLL